MVSFHPGMFANVLKGSEGFGDRFSWAVQAISTWKATDVRWQSYGAHDFSNLIKAADFLVAALFLQKLRCADDISNLILCSVLSPQDVSGLMKLQLFYTGRFVASEVICFRTVSLYAR